MGSTIFISYAIADTYLYHITEISKQLSSFEDIDQVFCWEEHANRNIVDYMVERIKACDIVVLFCSPVSLKSQAVQNEYKTAQNLGKPILPVFIDLQYIPAALKLERGVQFNIYDVQANIPEIYKVVKAKLVQEAEEPLDKQTEMFFTRWDDVHFLDPKNEFNNKAVFMRRGGILQVDIDEGFVARHPVIDLLENLLGISPNTPLSKFVILEGKAASGKDTVIRLLASEMQGAFYYFKFDIEEASNLDILRWIESEIKKLSQLSHEGHPPIFVLNDVHLVKDSNPLWKNFILPLYNNQKFQGKILLVTRDSSKLAPDNPQEFSTDQQGIIADLIENNNFSIILENWHGGTFNYLCSYLSIYFLIKEKPEQFVSDLIAYQKYFLWDVFDKSNALDMSLIRYVCDLIDWPDEIHPDTELIIEGNVYEQLLDKLGSLNYQSEFDASVLSVVLLISYLSRFEIPMPVKLLQEILEFSGEVQLETVIDSLVARHYLTYVKKLGPIFTPSYKFYHSTAAENYFQAILSMKVDDTSWLCNKIKPWNDTQAPIRSCVHEIENEIIQYLNGNADWQEILYHFLQENMKLQYGNENWEYSLHYLDEMIRLDLPLNNRYYELKGAALQKLRKFDDALELYNQAFELNKSTNNFYGQAVDLNHMGLIHRELGQPEKALSCYHEALQIHRETENKFGEASILSNVGTVEKNMGRFKDAISHLQESFSLFNQLGKKKGISKNVRTIATILNTMGDTDNALYYAEKVALPIDESTNDKYSMSLDFDLLGKIYRRRREFIESITSLKEALKLKQDIGNENGQATTLGELGRVYRQMKKLDDALKMCDEALKIHSKYRNKHGIAYIQGTMGTIYKFKGDLDKSLKHYLAALEFHKEIKNKHGMAIEYRNVATIYNNKNKLDEAEEFYELALEADRDSQEITRDTQAITLGKLGILSRKKKNYEKAHKYHQEALTFNEELQNIEGVARDLGNIGLNYWKWGKFDESLEYLNKATQIDEENGFNRHLAEMYGNLGQIYMNITPQETSHLEGAISNFQKSIQIKRRLDNIKPDSICMDLTNIARVYSHKLINKNEMAVESYFECYKINMRTNNRRGAENTLRNLFNVLGLIPHIARISYYQRLYTTDKSILNIKEADLFHKIKNSCENLKKRENWEELYDCEHLLYEIYSDTNQTDKKNEMLKSMGNICVRLKKPDDGITIFTELKEINEKLGKNYELVKNLRTMATFYKIKEDYLNEIRCYEQSLQLHEKANNLKEQAVDCNFLGNAYRHHGDKEKALKWFKQTKDLNIKLGNTKLAEDTENIIKNLEDSDKSSP